MSAAAAQIHRIAAAFRSTEGGAVDPEFVSDVLSKCRNCVQATCQLLSKLGYVCHDQQLQHHYLRQPSPQPGLYSCWDRPTVAYGKKTAVPAGSHVAPSGGPAAAPQHGWPDCGNPQAGYPPQGYQQQGHQYPYQASRASRGINSDWNCAKCTYVNPGGYQTCDMCAEPRPAVTMHGGGYPAGGQTADPYVAAVARELQQQHEEHKRRHVPGSENMTEEEFVRAALAIGAKQQLTESQPVADSDMEKIAQDLKRRMFDNLSIDEIRAAVKLNGGRKNAAALYLAGAMHEHESGDGGTPRAGGADRSVACQPELRLPVPYLPFPELRGAAAVADLTDCINSAVREEQAAQDMEQKLRRLAEHLEQRHHLQLQHACSRNELSIEAGSDDHSLRVYDARAAPEAQ